MKLLTGSFTKKQLIAIALGLIVFYFSFDYLGDLMYRASLNGNSDAILAAVHSAKVSPRIISHTGEIVAEQYNLHTPPTSQDSASLRINLEGEKSTVTIEAQAIKLASGVWKIYKSDTTYSN